MSDIGPGLHRDGCNRAGDPAAANAPQAKGLAPESVTLAGLQVSAGIDTTNDQFVGASTDGSGKICVTFPKVRMSRAEALRHAAWLVALAEREDGEFAAVLAAVRST